jgi:3-oxoacyl-[acyl-carrier-protein] synthase-3
MSQPLCAAIYGTGSHLPAKVMANADFEKFLDTSDEWITSRTGIKNRRVTESEAATSDLCVAAARQAIADAEVALEEIDLVLVATASPDYFSMPSCACIVQNKLGLSETVCGAVDMVAACSGFIYCLATAKAFVETGIKRCVLVIGGEALSRLTDYQDRGTCILFGDGAGAAVVGPQRTRGKSHRIGEVTMHAKGSGCNLLVMPGGGSKNPATTETVAKRMHYIRMDGREVFKFGVTTMIGIIDGILKRHNWTANDLGLIVPHQANTRIIDAAVDRLNLPPELFFQNLSDYGNTSAGTIPIALDEAAKSGRIPEGKPVLLVGFGGGLTWGSAVLYW